jgi:hypothetical protein
MNIMLQGSIYDLRLQCLTKHLVWGVAFINR